MIELAAPPSKSITQRALILAALSDRGTILENPLVCDDSRVLVAALGALGVSIDRQPDAWTIDPPARFAAPGPEPLPLGNAGTAVRFLAGLAPLIPGPFTLDGDPAMRRRPLAALVAALETLGVRVTELGRHDCPPLRFQPGALERPPDEVQLPAAQSSQEISALLMLGCRLPAGLRLHLAGPPPSWPYVELTMRVMRAFGVDVRQTGPEWLVVAPGPPRAERFEIEGDWSGASFPLAAGWLTGREVRVVNVAGDSAQGDRVFPRLLRRLSQPGPRVFALNATPDLVPPLAACALFADGTTEITGVSHLRIKESDRLAVFVRETKKINADVRETPNGLTIQPRPLRAGATLDPAADHRMAMAFGLISLRVPGIEILDPACVAKSYPDFWAMLENFR